MDELDLSHQPKLLLFELMNELVDFNIKVIKYKLEFQHQKMISNSQQ